MGISTTHGRGQDAPTCAGTNDRRLEPIAIVGAACRLPGEASSLHGLWDMMRNSRTAHAKVPKERWDADAWYHPDPDRKGSLNTTHGFFLEQDVGAFDAPFFSVTAKEAAGMDPAKRLLLEVAYEAFENAGLPMDDVAGSMTGVYVGSMTSDYEVLSTREIYDEPHMAAAGSSEAMTANRVSWFFDLRGPSLTLDTACSSSLYALHLACQSLRLGETNMALVAGVNVILHPNFMQQLVAMHMLSPDGISHTFDDRANGYGRGEGIGGLVVKRLSDAVRDGDTIRAVIRGSGVNVDGKTPSVTMPSPEAQADLIRAVYNEAGLSLDKTQYIELHGTGTPVGDPIELSAIAGTFGACASPQKPVYVGSIKPSVGHTEGCAGLAGVFKAIMCLEKGVILPTAEVDKVNPKLRFADWNLALPGDAMSWPEPGLRRISVNSFGFGGANAHVILDDAYHYMQAHGLSGNHATVARPRLLEAHPVSSNEAVNGNGAHVNGCQDAPAGVPQKKLFVLSSRDEPGISRMAKSLEAYWRSKHADGVFESAKYASNVAYTLASRRSLLDYRSFAVAESVTMLSRQLQKPLPRLKRSTKQNGIAFVFTGQGAQWAGMGRQLIEFPVFAASISRSKACLETLGCPFDLEAELAKTEHSKIGTPEYSQPICTAVQVALVDLLAEWAIRPKAVVGHSSGEIAAAYAAGILTHEDAIKVAHLRGVYSGKVSLGTRRGAMLAAGISEGEARGYLEAVPPESVVVACVNSPKSVTLSGDAEYIDQLEGSMSKDGKFARKLRVTTAYHSPHMKTVADDCLDAMVKAGVGEPRETTIPLFSSVTGHLMDPAEVGKDYWLRNMCGTVRFSEAVHSLLGHGDAPGRRAARKTTVKWSALVEIGPHSALKAPLVQIMEGVDSKLPSQLSYMSMLVRGEDAVVSSLTAAGHLWALGLPISLDKVNREAAAPAKPQAVVDLPAYPWNHERRYWHEAAATKEQRLQHRARSDLLGIAVENQNPFEPEWRNFLGVRENPWVEDHKITGTTLYPGAGMLIMVIEAVQQMVAEDVAVKGVEFRSVHFERGLVIPSEGGTETRLRIQAPPRSESPSEHAFAVYSRTGDGSWTKHCFGAFSIINEESGAQVGQDLASLEWKTHLETYDAMKKLPSTDVDVTKLYKSLHKVGMQYGPTFQNLTALVALPEAGCCHGTISIPDTKSVMPREFEFPHVIHPATLDAIFHLLVVAVANGTSLTEAAVPMMLEKLFISFRLPRGAGSLFSGYSQRVERRDKQLAADLVVSDESWSEPKIIVKGLIMRQVTAGTSDPGNDGLLTATASQNKVTKIVWKLDPASALKRSAATPSNQIRIARLRDWLELECHKSHSLRVLLVGHTLGQDVLGELDPFVTGKSPYRGFASCTVVDSSEDALQQWKTQTTGATAAMRFGLVDSMPTTEEALFDLIIVGHGDAAVQDSSAESSRWRSLASPHGRILVLHGSSNKDHQDGLNGCGPVPSHAVSRPVTLSLPDGARIDVYTRRDEVDSKRADDVCLLVPSTVHAITASLEKALRDCLHKSGVTARTVHLEDALSLRGQRVISLLGDSFVTDWNRTEFEQFQSLVSCAAHVFWITTGAHMVAPSETGLRGAPVPGLLRVLRNELPQITLAHLDLSPTFDAAKPLAGELVVDAWLASLDDSVPNMNRDLELAELDGDILVPRVVTEPLMGMEIALATRSAPPIPKPLSSSGPLRLVEGHEVAWQSDEEALEALGPEHVEVKVVDISVDSASPVARELLGSQVTGRVVRCGSHVTEFQQGQLVVALGAPGVRTNVRLHRSMLLQLPESIPIEGAATAVWTLMTACYVLRHVTHLASGQRLLIQDGATSLGQALIYVALETGRVDVFVTVTSLEQKAHLVERFRLPDETVIVVNRHHDGGHLAAYFMSKTNRQGLDVVVCSMDMAGDLVPCLSDFARVAVMSIASQSSRAPPAALLSGNLTVSTVNAVHILRETPRLVSKLLREVSGFIQSDGRGLPDTMSRAAFPITDFPDALEWMQKPEHGGIVSLHIPSSDSMSGVPVIPAPPPKLELDPDASYVLAGGLGSLGLRIADVMARSGATHLVFLSRSGGARWTERLRELNRRGCATIVLKCDVSSLNDVRNAVSEVAESGRPIKGVIQCAMVLQDSLFESMTLEHWRTAFEPKVAGSWNLHQSLPRAMDFFVMLSSVVSVIGNVSQANYAAGNAYMDALAHYRRSLGLAAVSINAGLVADSDHTIDGTAMDDYLDRFQHMASVSTTLPELDIAVTAAMRGTTAGGAALEPQFVFCMSDSLRPDGVDHWARDAKFSHRTAGDEAAGADDSSGPSIGQALGATTSRQDAVLVVQDALKKLLAPGLGIQPADIDEDRPLYHAGVDSFKAVEIRNQVFRELKSDISVFEILSPSSLAQLSGVVVSRSQLVPPRVREARDEP